MGDLAFLGNTSVSRFSSNFCIVMIIAKERHKLKPNGPQKKKNKILCTTNQNRSSVNDTPSPICLGDFGKAIGGNMSEKLCLRKWKTSDNDLARAIDEKTPGRAKIKSGLLFKLIIGIGLLAILCTFAIPNPKAQLKKEIHKIANASPDRIGAGELASLLNSQNQDMISQTQISKKELDGKIVEWELEILVVAILPDHFKILTKPTSTHPGTLLTVYPQNSQQKKYMANVQSGTEIKIKKKIAGILQGRIKINPAILM